MDFQENNQAFYRRLDDLCGQLREVGLGRDARRIEYLLHEVAWTSAGELFLELQNAIERTLASEGSRKMPTAIRQELENDLQLLRTI